MNDGINFISVEKAYPETNGNAAHILMKCSSGKITKGMYYNNGGKPTFAAYGSEVSDVIAWAYPNKKQ